MTGRVFVVGGCVVVVDAVVAWVELVVSSGTVVMDSDAGLVEVVEAGAAASSSGVAVNAAATMTTPRAMSA